MHDAGADVPYDPVNPFRPDLCSPLACDSFSQQLLVDKLEEANIHISELRNVLRQVWDTKRHVDGYYSVPVQAQKFEIGGGE